MRKEKWRRKIAFLRALEKVPKADRVYDWIRLSFGNIKKMNLDNRWYAIVEMLQILKGAGIKVEGKELAEIGAGWHPLLGPLFHGLGAKSITMSDISPHFRADFIEKSVGYLISRAEEISKMSGVPKETLLKRWQEILPAGGNWRSNFESHGMRYIAPLDFTKTGWPDNHVDMVYSNSCLCYIPTPILKGIIKEAHRVTRPGGWFAHNIDPVDDLGGGLNFLTMSKDEWEEAGCCSLHYQNRWRPADYRKAAEEAGFVIKYDERTPFKSPPAQTRADLHPDFRDLPETELFTFHMLLAAQKPA